MAEIVIERQVVQTGSRIVPTLGVSPSSQPGYGATNILASQKLAHVDIKETGISSGFDLLYLSSRGENKQKNVGTKVMIQIRRETQSPGRTRNSPATALLLK